MAASAGVNKFKFQSWKRTWDIRPGWESSGCVLPEWRRQHRTSALCGLFPGTGVDRGSTPVPVAPKHHPLTAP